MIDLIMGLLCFGIPVAIIVWAIKAINKKREEKSQLQKDPTPEVEANNSIGQTFLSNGLRFQFPKGGTIDITNDEFEGTKTLAFKTTAGYGLDKYMFFGGDNVQFRIGFRTENTQNKILFGTLQKEVKLKKGDKVSLLFEDGTREDFILEENGYKVEKDEEGVMIESFAFLNDDQIEKFTEVFLSKWRLYYSEKLPLTGEVDPTSQVSFQEAAVAYSYALENFYNKDNYLKE